LDFCFPPACTGADRPRCLSRANRARAAYPHFEEADVKQVSRGLESHRQQVAASVTGKDAKEKTAGNSRAWPISRKPHSDTTNYSSKYRRPDDKKRLSGGRVSTLSGGLPGDAAGLYGNWQR